MIILVKDHKKLKHCPSLNIQGENMIQMNVFYWPERLGSEGPVWNWAQKSDNTGIEGGQITRFKG